MMLMTLSSSVMAQDLFSGDYSLNECQVRGHKGLAQDKTTISVESSERRDRRLKFYGWSSDPTKNRKILITQHAFSVPDTKYYSSADGVTMELEVAEDLSMRLRHNEICPMVRPSETLTHLVYNLECGGRVRDPFNISATIVVEKTSGKIVQVKANHQLGLKIVENLYRKREIIGDMNCKNEAFSEAGPLLSVNDSQRSIKEVKDRSPAITPKRYGALRE